MMFARDMCVCVCVCRRVFPIVQARPIAPSWPYTVTCLLSVYSPIWFLVRAFVSPGNAHVRAELPEDSSSVFWNVDTGKCVYASFMETEYPDVYRGQCADWDTTTTSSTSTITSTSTSSSQTRVDCPSGWYYVDIGCHEPWHDPEGHKECKRQSILSCSFGLGLG